MAIRLPRRSQVLSAAAVAVTAAALLAPSTASATPADPSPPRTVAAAQQRLSTLAMKNSQLDEQVNRARLDLNDKERAAAKARVAANAAAVSYEQARMAMSATVAAQYEGGSFSATGALLSSESGQGYLDKLQTLSMLGTHAAQVAKQMGDAKSTADAATKQAAALVQDAAARRDALQKQKDSLHTQIETYRTLLASLTAQQRAAYQRTLAPPVRGNALMVAAASLANGPVPGAVKKAITYALAQVGKSYSWGAAGPSSFDCSGLTMMAYASAGISLPHSAAGQYGYGTHVPLNALKPGDLIFYYSPIGHVTIYIGGGLMVSASTEGTPISEMAVGSMSGAVGATRIVG